MDVFRALTAKLLSVQKKLDPEYHEDALLRDRLLSAIYLPHVRTSLRERIPKIAL